MKVLHFPHRSYIDQLPTDSLLGMRFPRQMGKSQWYYNPNEHTIFLRGFPSSGAASRRMVGYFPTSQQVSVLCILENQGTH